MTDTREMTQAEKYALLLEFVQEVAGDGYLNTRGTARDVLKRVGEKPAPRYP